MMRFDELIPGAPKIMLSGIAQDSRQVQAGDLFIAVSGINGDGRNFILDAAAKGAVAIIYEKNNFSFPVLNIPCLGVDNLGEQIPSLASKFYAYPSQKIPVVGITGTNGKTSISQLLAQLLSLLDKPCGVIGTLGYGFYPKLTPISNTTPGTCELQQILAKLVQDKAEVCAMEVSSHALAQNRVQEVNFEVAVFSNLSRDHLDYHGDMSSYAKAKAKLFALKNLLFKVVNVDDEFGRKLAAEQSLAQLITYSLINSDADIYADDICLSKAGICSQIRVFDEKLTINSQLLGAFNLSNLLAVIGSACALGFSFKQIVPLIAKLQAPIGRMHCLGTPNTPQVVVDYAHTPDALSCALHAVKNHTQGKLICVFGCGGDRDQGKRAQMAQVAKNYADYVIVTADNSRSEDITDIFADIKQGFASLKDVGFIAEREDAIAQAIKLAQKQDLVLIAGKGHEDYQEFLGVKKHFSDIECASMQLTKWSGG